MRALLLSILLLFSVNSFAQIGKDDVNKFLQTDNRDTIAWVHAGLFTLGINAGFLHNSPTGGELGSLTISSIFTGAVIRYYNNKVWTNNLDLAYGLNYIYSQGFIPHKTDDRIDFTSKYSSRFKRSKNMYLSGLFNFRSQFTKGYDYNQAVWDTTSTSNFLSPAYFTLAAGVEYRKGSMLSIFISPLAAREVLADKYYTGRHTDGAYGVPSGESATFQLGAYFSGRYFVNINKRALFKTRLDLYMNYLAKDKKDNTGAVIKKDNPGNVDIYWDNLFSYGIGKFLNLTVGLTLAYDNDVPYSATYVDATGATVNKNEPGQDFGWWQVKQILAFGIQYKFQ